MATITWPTTIDSSMPDTAWRNDTSHSDGTEDGSDTAEGFHALQHNKLALFMAAVENELGADPSGILRQRRCAPQRSPDGSQDGRPDALVGHGAHEHHGHGSAGRDDWPGLPLLLHPDLHVVGWRHERHPHRADVSGDHRLRLRQGDDPPHDRREPCRRYGQATLSVAANQPC